MIHLPLSARSLYYGQPINRQHPLNRGLVSEWAVVPLRGKGNTLFDLSRQSNHGTFTTNVKWGSGGKPFGFGSVSTAGEAAADGIMNSAATGIPTTASATASWTIAYAHRTRSYKSLSAPVVFGNERSSTAVGSRRGILQFNNNYYAWGESADWDTAVAYDVDGIWHWIVLTFDGTNRTLYRDGILAAGPSATGVGSFSTTASYIYANAAHPSGTLPDAEIDNYSIWDRAFSSNDQYVWYLESRRGNPTRWNWISTRTYFNTAGGAVTSKPFYFRHYIAGRAA